VFTEYERLGAFARGEAAVDVVDDTRELSGCGDDVVGTEGEEVIRRLGDELFAVAVREFREGLLGEADFIAGVNHGDGPAACGFRFCNIDGGVADFDESMEGVEPHVFGGVVDHPGGRPATSDEVGSQEDLGVETALLGRGKDGGHHVGLEACCGGIADVAAFELEAELGDAGEDFAVVGKYLELEGGELRVDAVDVFFGGSMAVGSDPARGDLRVVEC